MKNQEDVLQSAHEDVLQSAHHESTGQDAGTQTLAPGKNADATRERQSVYSPAGKNFWISLKVADDIKRLEDAGRLSIIRNIESAPYTEKANYCSSEALVHYVRMHLTDDNCNNVKELAGAIARRAIGRIAKTGFEAGFDLSTQEDFSVAVIEKLYEHITSIREEHFFFEVNYYTSLDFLIKSVRQSFSRRRNNVQQNETSLQGFAGNQDHDGINQSIESLGHREDDTVLLVDQFRNLLEEPIRSVVELSWKGFDRNEIAESLNIDVRTVYNRLKKAEKLANHYFYCQN